MSTLLLDRTTNDLCLNAAGHIAVAEDPYATSQNVATACKLKLGELYYDTTAGVDFDTILSGSQSLSWIKGQFVDAALSVPGVVSAVFYVSAFSGRKLSGQIQYTTATGSGAVTI